MERTLTTIPGSVDDQRTSLVEVTGDDGNVSLEIRAESQLETFGWVVQKRVALDASAVKNLQCALNLFLGSTRVEERDDNVVELGSFRNRRKAS